MSKRTARLSMPVKRAGGWMAASPAQTSIPTAPEMVPPPPGMVMSWVVWAVTVQQRISSA